MIALMQQLLLLVPFMLNVSGRMLSIIITYKKSYMLVNVICLDSFNARREILLETLILI